jgi:hypothetical protein
MTNERMSNGNSCVSGFVETLHNAGAVTQLRLEGCGGQPRREPRWQGWAAATVKPGQGESSQSDQIHLCKCLEISTGTNRVKVSQSQSHQSKE